MQVLTPVTDDSGDVQVQSGVSVCWSVVSDERSVGGYPPWTLCLLLIVSQNKEECVRVSACPPACVCVHVCARG